MKNSNLTENQRKIVDFLEENLESYYTAGDIQDAVFGRAVARRRGFGNSKAMNSLRGLVKKGIVFKSVQPCMTFFIMYRKYKG